MSKIMIVQLYPDSQPMEYECMTDGEVEAMKVQSKRVGAWRITVIDLLENSTLELGRNIRHGK